MCDPLDPRWSSMSLAAWAAVQRAQTPEEIRQAQIGFRVGLEGPIGSECLPTQLPFIKRLHNKTQVQLVWGCVVRTGFRSGAQFEYRDDPEIPVEVRQTLFRMDYGLVGPLALMGAELAHDVPSDWMIEAVYKQLTSASMLWLDWMTVTFGVSVPENAREPTDWASIQQRHLASREARSESAKAFLEGGSVMRRVLG